MKFKLAGHILPYDLYFIETRKYAAPTTGGVFKNILTTWTNALLASGSEEITLFLPYGPDDQWTDSLKVDQLGDRLTLKEVKLGIAGYQIDFDDLESFIVSPQEILEESPHIFGEFTKTEFVTALQNAQVIDA